MSRHIMYITALALLPHMHISAQEVATQVALGHANLLDTYLSPEKYRGFEGRFISEVVRQSKKHPLTYTLMHEGTVASTHNRAGNASQISGFYDFTYGLMYSTKAFGDKLSVRVGGMGNFDLGFTYNMRNSSNNPAQAYTSLAIGPQVMLGYTLRVGKMPLRLQWQARMPLVGVMFSPNYGQSYYEIFNRGNYDHNAVFTSVATPQLRHHFTVDVPMSERYSLRVGYLGDYRQAEPNKLKQHHYFNAATIGFVIKK